MTQLKLFQIDAFASMVFRGNPAAVCPLERWLEDDLMQAIAAENNLAETAFFVSRNDSYALRWFTPRYEVDLCGHATLASAFVIFTVLDPSRDSVRFETRSGPLWVRRNGDLLEMDFPLAHSVSCDEPPADLLRGLGRSPRAVLVTNDNYIAVYDTEDDVRALRPDLVPLEDLHPRGVVVTAPGTDVDFVSRYFAPSYGIPEDPATGSTHCALVPYWADRLHKGRLHARQVSQRGGEVLCEVRGDRVALSGQAVLYLEGDIYP